jgi:hypothetical protein
MQHRNMNAQHRKFRVLLCSGKTIPAIALAMPAKMHIHRRSVTRFIFMKHLLSEKNETAL